MPFLVRRRKIAVAEKGKPMESIIYTKLEELPIMGDIGVSETKDIIASICGVTPSAIMKVRARFAEYSDAELREHLIAKQTRHSLPRAAREAMDEIDAVKHIMKILGKCGPTWKRVTSGGPTWKRVGSFLVLSAPRYSLFGIGPRDPFSLIVRTAKSTWKLYDLSMFVLTVDELIGSGRIWK